MIANLDFEGWRSQNAKSAISDELIAQPSRLPVVRTYSTSPLPEKLFVFCKAVQGNLLPIRFKEQEALEVFKEKAAMKSSLATGPQTQLAMATLMMLCFVAHAKGQFEINPDHFDSPPTSVTTQASPQQLDLQARIAEQNRMLGSYYAQIKATSQEVEDIWQDLIAHGTEAGQDIALQVRQKELGRLRNTLAAQIRTAQETLVYLENQQRSLRVQARPVSVPRGVRPARIRSQLHRGTTLRASLRAAQ